MHLWTVQLIHFTTWRASGRFLFFATNKVVVWFNVHNHHLVWLLLCTAAFEDSRVRLLVPVMCFRLDKLIDICEYKVENNEGQLTITTNVSSVTRRTLKRRLRDRSIFTGELGPVHFKSSVWKSLYPILRENKQK